MEHQACEAHDAAIDYILRGFQPVHYPNRQKGPIRDGWPDERMTLEDVERIFNVPLNMGLILCGVADIDLDCAEAVSIAPHFLPATQFRFGRQSKRIAHYF